MSAPESWISFVVGRAINPDRFAGNQCVDVVDHFGEYIFEVPWQQCVGGVRGAKDLLAVAPDEYWIRIDYFHGFIPQRFDVLVFAGDDLNEWGHTAVTESATNTYIDVLQQDGFAAPHQFVDGNWYSAKPAHRARLAYSARGTGPLLGVLRPRPAKIIGGGIRLQGTTTNPSEEDDVANTQEELQEAVQTVLRDNKIVIGGRSVAAGVNQALLGIDVVNANIAQLKAFIAQSLVPEAGVKSESEGTFYFKGTDKPEVYALDAATGNVRHVQSAEFDVVKAISLYKEVEQAQVDALLKQAQR